MDVARLDPHRLELELLFSGANEYPAPRKVLAGLAPEDACRRVADCPHTIAELVAHLDFWQQWQLAYVRGEDPDLAPDFKNGVTDFRPVAPEEWESLCESFLTAFEAMIAAAEQPAALERIVFEKCDVGFMLVSHSSHNAYHLGQIVLMRRMLNLWPME